MEPLTQTARIAAADSVATEELACNLASLAALTFPLACPPAVTRQHIAAFVEANLSAACFADYLLDPSRAIFTARQGGRIVGYAMLVRGSADARLVKLPTAELSKLYLLPDFHGAGTAAALMDAALAAANQWSVRSVWLGVNQHNQRAQRFYTKRGFTIIDTRAFRLGTHIENDYIMVREF